MFYKVKNIIKALMPNSWWQKMRLHAILRQHKKVADFWQPIIQAYYNGNIKRYALEPKKTSLVGKKLIWQYWGQGIKRNDLPEIVDFCFRSVDVYKGEYQVIRLTDDTIAEYMDLPDFVWEKRKNPAFTRTFFSDLLRIALLTAYGGVWLDATVLLTAPLAEEYEKPDFFMFQRSKEEVHKDYWQNAYAYYYSWHPEFKVKMLSSIFFARKDTAVVGDLCNLMLYFWESQNTVPDYFTFQILFNELMEGPLADYNCPIVNDCIPHLLQTMLNGSYDYLSLGEVLQLTGIHKMSYLQPAAMQKLRTWMGENGKL